MTADLYERRYDMTDEKDVVIKSGVLIMITALVVGILLNLANIGLSNNLNSLDQELNQVKNESDVNDIPVKTYTETKPINDTNKQDDHKILNLNLNMDFDFSLLSLGLFSSAMHLMLYKDKIFSFINRKRRKRKKCDIVIDANKERRLTW